jgi:hypothetical protein
MKKPKIIPRSIFTVAAAVAMAMATGGVALAAPTAKAQGEIDALIAGLGASGCQFERNGSWYEAKAARDHLQKKYTYLRKHDMADTAELFIERGASKSSMSGKSYRVRCQGKAPETSERWFRQRLQLLRAAPTH